MTQSYTVNWEKAGFKNTWRSFSVINHENSGVDFSIHGLVQSNLTGDGCIKLGINNQASDKKQHTYTIIFSEKVNLEFEVHELNCSTNKSCYDDELHFSKSFEVYRKEHVVVGDQRVEPNISKQFRYNGVIGVKFKEVDTLVITHGSGDFCNPGRIQLSHLKFSRIVKEDFKQRGFQSVLYFGKDDDKVSDAYQPLLDSIVGLAEEDTTKMIFIVGYTDSIGTVSYNVELSKRRVKEVQRYLLKKGISNNQIEIDYQGERDPIDSNDHEKGRALNRRVELSLVKPDQKKAAK